MSNKNYRFFMPSQLQFGSGITEKIGGVLSGLGSKRVLIVTDKGLVSAGLIDKISKYIEKSGQNTIVFSEIKPNPSEALSFPDMRPEYLIEELCKYQKRLGIPKLSSFDIKTSDFQKMAEESMGEFSNCNTNPREVSVSDAVSIFESAANA